LAFAGPDPDESRSICEIVRNKKYNCTTYNITTSDGYILETFRVQTYGANSSQPPVLLWHGLMDSSFTWVLNEPNESLPYILASTGYDVWMSNTRGNHFGERNTNLSPADDPFWEFSFDQFAQIDVPDVIDYILADTGYSNLTYVGHSQGTLQMFASLTSGWTPANKINLFIALAPVTTVGHITNALFLLLANNLSEDIWGPLFGKKGFLLTPEGPIKDLFEETCYLSPWICDDVIEFLCGPHKGAFNNSRMDVMAGHEPGGTSTQNMKHWAQLVRDKNFQMYGYGSTGNMQHYGQKMAPLYDLGKYPTSVPLVLVTGGEDELADPTDVQILLASLPMDPILWQYIPNYAHLDPVWAIDAAEQIYLPNLLPLIGKYNTVNNQK